MAEVPAAVVVGGSAAGVSAAIAIREGGFAGSITLVDADPNQPYERPPLSKSFMTDPGGPLTPIVPPDSYLSHDIELLLGTRVERLDRERRRIVLATGEQVPADTVILATGATPRRLHVPGAELENIVVLRDAQDAAELAKRCAGGGPVVLVGAGYIGLELASALRSSDYDVTVVDVAPLPLVGTLGPRLAGMMLELHKGHGVRFILNATVSSFVGESQVEAVILGDGTVLPAATVIVGVGVTPNVDLARPLGVGSDAGIPVDKQGQTRDPWIWAAGDVAIQGNRHLEAPARIEHWDTACRHGQVVGRAVAGLQCDADILPYVWSEQYGLMLQSFGRPRLGDDAVVQEGASESSFAAYWLRRGRLAAVTTLARPREASMAKRLIEMNASVEAASLRDPSTDLRALVRAAVASGHAATSRE